MNWSKFWETNNSCMSLGKNIDRVPVLIDLPGDWVCEEMQLDNSRYYSDFDYQFEARERCDEQVYKEMGLHLTRLIDFGVIQDASIYGGIVNYEKKATPTLSPAIQDPDEILQFIEKMDRTNPMEAGLIPKYLEWREKYRVKTGIELTYGLSQKGAATMLGQICTITNFLTWTLTDPEMIELLVDCWIRTSIRYLDCMRRITGTTDRHDTFSIQSDVSGLMSPAMYRNMLMHAEKMLYDNYATDVGAVRYYHSDSHMLQHLDALREIGVNQVNIDPYIEPKRIMEKIPGVIIHGQIPPTGVLLYGKPEEIVNTVLKDIEQAGPTKQLIVTTAGSINPGTSLNNLKLVCETVERHGYIYS